MAGVLIRLDNEGADRPVPKRLLSGPAAYLGRALRGLPMVGRPAGPVLKRPFPGLAAFLQRAS